MLKHGLFGAVATLAVLAQSPVAHADFDTPDSLRFRSSSDRMAQISAENLRIQAENLYFQQQFLVESLQRGQNINNMILINQLGNGSIDLRADQRSNGDQTIDNDISGSIGFGY